MKTKITKATLKSFINKNKNNLYLKIQSKFDGMQDCVVNMDDNFEKVNPDKINFTNKNTLGISGCWLVGGSRNSFYEYDSGKFKGIHVYNCCGSFTIATKK